jgi:hypothetical protein
MHSKKIGTRDLPFLASYSGLKVILTVAFAHDLDEPALISKVKRSCRNRQSKPDLTGTPSRTKVTGNCKVLSTSRRASGSTWIGSGRPSSVRVVVET